VRVVVSLALGTLLGGIACLASYGLAEWVPAWSWRYGGFVRPTDELVGSMFALAGVGWILGLSWIWTRRRNTLHEFWKAAVLTVAVSVITVVLCLAVSGNRAWGGGEDILVGGLVCVGTSAVILAWVQAGRRYVRTRQWSHASDDGRLDLRCPSCNYRMVGLHESRCPECGTGYTLDELLAHQSFMERGRPIGVPVRVPPPPDGNGAES